MRTSLMRPRLLAAIPLLSAACGSHLLGPDLERRLTRFGGCGDMVLFVVDAEDEIMITFDAKGLVVAAHDVGMETTALVEFPSEDVDLGLGWRTRRPGAGGRGIRLGVGR